jgi:ribosomal-protein-alanine N-acetyltransferase
VGDRPITGGWRIATLTPEFARDICTWSYPAPYDRYDLTGSDPEDFHDPAHGYLALVDASDALVGYRCFGPEGQVPGGVYLGDALDTGGGLRPELTGRGLGRAAIRLGLEYGWRVLDAPALRVTVWSRNVRALRVVRSLGFTTEATFNAQQDAEQYEILTLPNPRR